MEVRRAGKLGVNAWCQGGPRPQLSSRRFRYGTEPSLAGVELLHCRRQIRRGKVRPTAIGEVQLCVRAFPEKEIAEALLAPGSDEKVDVPALSIPVIDLAHRRRQLLA